MFLCLLFSIEQVHLIILYDRYRVKVAVIILMKSINYINTDIMIWNSRVLWSNLVTFRKSQFFFIMSCYDDLEALH